MDLSGWRAGNAGVGGCSVSLIHTTRLPGYLADQLTSSRVQVHVFRSFIFREISARFIGNESSKLVCFITAHNSATNFLFSCHICSGSSSCSPRPRSAPAVDSNVMRSSAQGDAQMASRPAMGTRV
jgi:hypothetical protein